MSSSRYRRPDTPQRRVVLQERDYAVIAAVTDYRVLLTRHLRTICFPATSLRQVQARLRLLWEHGFLNRYFKPVLFNGEKPETLAGC
jgi:hypothetical protein